MRRIAITSAALAALAACAPAIQPATSTYREVGIGEGFGAATLANIATQTGQVDYRVSLARRFAAEVPTTINFAFNSYALDDAARATLRAQADWIRQFPEVRFRVYGHTDLVGTQGYNRQLGLRRAEAAVLYLMSQGIGRERLEAVVSYGEEQPLIVTEGQERANRRTVTDVSGFVESRPGELNGKYAEIIFRDYVASAAVPAPEVGVTETDFAEGNQ